MLITICDGTSTFEILSGPFTGTFTGTVVRETSFIITAHEEFEEFEDPIVVPPKSNIPPYRELSSKCKKGGKKKRW